MAPRWTRDREARSDADHFVILVLGTRDHALALRDEAAATLAPMGLRLLGITTVTGH